MNMHDFTKEELAKYIAIRRNAIEALINALSGTDLYGLQVSLNELEALENWFDE